MGRQADQHVAAVSDAFPQPDTGDLLTDPLPYVTQLGLGSRGPAVEASKRAVYRFINDGPKWQGFIRQPPAVRRTFGPWFVKDVRIVQGLLSIDQTGRIDKPTLNSLVAAGSFDAPARELWLEQFAHPKPPPLVEPRQGFDSLVADMWEAYSIGRRMNLVDLGTFNPASRLPSGHASDHATSKLNGHIGEPACAFDLGFSPQNGYSNPIARAFFHRMIGRPEVSYVILGDWIWSQEKGLHAYTAGGHSGHVHTSGHRR